MEGDCALSVVSYFASGEGFDSTTGGTCLYIKGANGLGVGGLGVGNLSAIAIMTPLATSNSVKASSGSNTMSGCIIRFLSCSLICWSIAATFLPSGSSQSDRALMYFPQSFSLLSGLGSAYTLPNRIRASPTQLPS